MCRLLCIIDLQNHHIDTNLLINYLWKYDNAIFSQCIHIPYSPNDENNDKNHQINIDGFGIGYYCNNCPIVYKNTFPCWNDLFLPNLINQISTPILHTHIRAVDSGNMNKNKPIVHQYNCHPFIHNEYIFVHNGSLSKFNDGKVRRDMINEIDFNYLPYIIGNTDSEYLFYLILTNINKYSNNKWVNKTLSWVANNMERSTINCIISTLKETIVIRWGTHGTPSLYISNIDNIMTISSEPIKKQSDEFALISDNTFVHIKNNEIMHHPIIL